MSILVQSLTLWFGSLLLVNSLLASPIPSVQSVAAEVETITDADLDPELRKKVDFWIQIYSQYTTRQGLVHDSKYIDRIYEVVHFDPVNGSRAKDSKLVKHFKTKWKNVLLSVHKKRNHPETFTHDEKQVFDLYRDIDEPDKFLRAAHRKRLRFQLGQKDRFAEGLYQSGRFLPMMEEVFKQQGMPVELTRLPFVESSFNVKARSKVGASGIWQFMRSTGRLFIKVSDVIDERNDPIRATLGAAKLLKLNYQSLQRWPLAVTAYNHGRKGMMRAVRRVGSDELHKVISGYRQRSFGFASGNFFAEFLAAVEVERNAEKYFGKVERAKPVDFIEINFPHSTHAREVAKRLGLDFKEFKSLNPALTEDVFSGKFSIPAKYPIRIPYAEGEDRDSILKKVWENYSQIPAVYKGKVQRVTKCGTNGQSLGQEQKNCIAFPQIRGKRYAHN